MLHSLQQRRLVTCHLIELINAAHPEVTEHQSPGLEVLLVGDRVPDYGGGETGIGGGVTADVDASRRDIDDVLEHLRLTETRVAHHEHVDVRPDRRLPSLAVLVLVLVVVVVLVVLADHEV